MKNNGVITIRGKASRQVRRARFLEASSLGRYRDLFLIQDTGHVVYWVSILRRHEIVNGG